MFLVSQVTEYKWYGSCCVSTLYLKWFVVRVVSNCGLVRGCPDSGQNAYIVCTFYTEFYTLLNTLLYGQLNVGP